MTFAQARAAGTHVNVQSASGEWLLDFVPAKAFQSLVLSSPALAQGTAYGLYFGGSATGTATDGLYESGTYTSGTLLDSFTLTSTVTRAAF